MSQLNTVAVTGSMSRRAFYLRAIKGVLLALLLFGGALATQLGDTPQAIASHTSIKFPFAAGTSWSILQGYNANATTGGSHYNCDPATLRDTGSQTVPCSAAWQYRYSLDLYIPDGSTAGKQVLAPANGTIRWMQSSTGGISINLGDGYAVALFHVVASPGLAAGSELRQGQVIGTVAPANVAGAGSNPHVHFTLWETTDGGNWSRIARPFNSAASVDGYTFADLGTTSYNQHRGRAIASTNQPLSTGTLPATPTLSSPGSAASIPDGSSGVRFTWTAVSGATDYQVLVDGRTYSPWTTGTSFTSGTIGAGSHSWKVQAQNAAGTSVWSTTRSFSVATSAVTAPALNLSQTLGGAGITVTASGTGFASGETVQLRWDSPSTTPFAGVVANASGSFSTQFMIPDAQRGLHTVYARGVSSSTQVTAEYEVRPTLARTPTQGSPGTRVQVTVRGFAASETVDLYWKTSGGIRLGSVITNANGTGTVTISIPNSGPGWTDYVGVGRTSRASAYGAINVLTRIYISPSSASPGQTAKADAGGLPPSTAVTVSFNTVSGSGGTVVCSGTTSIDGIVRCQLVVPQVGAGSYPITIRAGSVSVTGNLLVTGPPAIALTPNDRAPGITVTVNAGGFQPGENVTFRWDNGATWKTVNADSNGAASFVATIPQVATGNHVVTGSGVSSGRSANMVYNVGAAQDASGVGMVSPGVYSVFATREGLVGGRTSSGHVIVENDYFVSLPGCTPTTCTGGFKPGNMTSCGTLCYVKVINPVTKVCRVEPIKDIGPWFTSDDWWSPISTRFLNNLASNPNDLAQGYPAAEAARNKMDVGYGVGANGYGQDNTGETAGRPYREVGNPSAIDLADGTWYDLAPQGTAEGARITVEMLWQTGANPASSATACGHPLNEQPGVTNPPGTQNPSFVGAKLTIVGSTDSPSTGRSSRAYDGDTGTTWTTYSVSPSTATLRIDLGANYNITGIKWKFRLLGVADQFTVRAIATDGRYRTFGPYGNGTTANTFYGVGIGYTTYARYIEFTFANPNRDTTLGSLAEIEVWGSGTAFNPPGTQNPSFVGAKLTIVGSTDSPSTGRSSRAYDGDTGTTWTTYSVSPSTATLRIDLGANYNITGIKWKFRLLGVADQFTVRAIATDGRYRTFGPYGNGTTANTFYGVGIGYTTYARYIEFTFANPNRDTTLGSLAEIEIWGGEVFGTASIAEAPSPDASPTTGTPVAGASPKAETPVAEASPAVDKPAEVIEDAATPAPATEEPTSIPTETPTVTPTSAPTEQPTSTPTEEPTSTPTEEPTAIPTEEPTVLPTLEPTATPTEEPTASPTEEPTSTPTEEPTQEPVVLSVGTITGTGGDAVNCRISPVDGEPITRISEGEPIDLTGPASEGWYPVLCDGQPGFIAEEFITEGSVTPTEPSIENEPTEAPTEDATDDVDDSIGSYPIQDSGDTENSGTAYLVTDGNPSTFWSIVPSQSPEQARLYVDLGQVLPIDRISLTLATFDQLPVFEIWLSTDGETWANATPGGINGWNLPRNEPVEISLGYDARYLRIVISEVDQQLGAGAPVGGIAELEVWPGDISQTLTLGNLGSTTPTPEDVKPTEEIVAEPTEDPVDEVIDDPVEEDIPTEEIIEEPPVEEESVPTGEPIVEEPVEDEETVPTEVPGVDETG
ncbi:MAG: discoidin domain-containing protein [Thermomicrobiales bacterium]